MSRIGVLALIVTGSLALASPAWADPPVDTAPTDQPPAAVAACRQFDAALDLAARSYDEFAYASAGNGDAVNYADQRVRQFNVVGRTALREAARAVLGASRTPGLAPEVSDPMRSWSLHATKLLVIMGVRGGGDSLNAAADQLNTDARSAQMACAQYGGRA